MTYRQGQGSFLEELDPRTRLVIAAAFATLAMLTSRLDWLGVEFTLLVAIIVVQGLGRFWLHWLRLLLVLAVIVVGVSLISFDLVTALSTALRLVAVASAFFWFFQVTAPEDLGDALVHSGMPYAFAFILTGTIQFVPVIARKLSDIRDAQRARGIRLETDLASLPNYLALLAPLLIQSFRLADDLAEAMESRGFGAPGRTFLREYRLQSLDYAVIILSVLVLMAGLIAQRMAYG